MQTGLVKRQLVHGGRGVKGQIETIAEVADQEGKLSEFIDIIMKAVQLLHNDPHGWCEMHSVQRNAMNCGCLFVCAVTNKRMGTGPLKTQKTKGPVPILLGRPREN